MKLKPVAALVLFVSGCVSFSTSSVDAQLFASFDATSANFINTTGANEISGNSFLRQSGGGIVTCSGFNVYLWPVTEYSSELMNRWFYDSASTQPPSSGYVRMGLLNFDGDGQLYWRRSPDYTSTAPEFRQFQKTTQCDSKGNFKFSNVASGDYFLMSKIGWKVGDNMFQRFDQGGYVLKKVSVDVETKVDVVMTHM